MPRIDEKELKHQIKNGLLKGTYLIYGNEPYLKNHYTHAIASAAAGAFADFNLHTFDAQDHIVSAQDIYMAACSCPMMGGKSCVVVRDLSPDTLQDQELELLIKVIEEPSDTCVMVWVLDQLEASPRKNNRWKMLFAAVEKHGALVQLDKLSTRSLETMLIAGARKRGCELLPDAAAELVAQAGDEMNLLLNELDKCCAYVGQGGTITPREIREVCVHSLDATAFDLVRAITARDAARAYHLLGELFEQRVEPILIHGAVAAAYVDMYRARVASESTGDPVAAASLFPSAYKGREFRLRNAARDSRKISTRSLRRCLDCLDEADRLLKGGGVQPRTILEETAVKLLKITGGEAV